MNENNVKILPSLLGADFLNLYKEIKDMENTGMFLHHIDIMDGHFVNNISFGKVILDKISSVMKKKMDIHLMIENPYEQIKNYIRYAPYSITIHSELKNEKEIYDTLNIIEKNNIKKGIAINPDSELKNIVKYLDYVDLVLIMSVQPGLGGQEFIYTTLDKLEELNSMRKNKNFIIEIDGGINMLNAKECISRGADWLVCGSSLYNAHNYFTFIENISNL